MSTGRLKKDLIGLKLTVVTNYLVNDRPLVHEYIIYAVYPYCVSAVRFTENGGKVVRSFSKGDLVTMGVINGREV